MRAFLVKSNRYTDDIAPNLYEYKPYGFQFFFRNSGNIYNGDYDICCLIATVGIFPSPNSLTDMPVEPRLLNICIEFTYCINKESLDSIIADE